MKIAGSYRVSKQIDFHAVFQIILSTNLVLSLISRVLGINRLLQLPDLNTSLHIIS